MNRNVKALLLTLLVSIFLFSLTTTGQEQIRGKALYETLRKGKGLMKFEGMNFKGLVFEIIEKDKASWTPDGQGYYIYKDKTFKRFDALTGEETNLFEDSKIIAAYNTITGKNVEKLPFKKLTFLEKGKKIRFMVSTKAFIYDLTTAKMISYVPEKEFRGVRRRIYREVFSPDYKYRAFTRDYNLYIKDHEDKEKALTKNGHEDLRKGFPDWVYPEELDQYEAFWWSPDSSRIAYMQFDESPVIKYPIVHDVSPVPRLEMMSYPKAGANNPIVNFFIVDIKAKKTVRIETGMETNFYFLRGKWTNDGKLFTFQRLNRWQNTLELFAADPKTGKIRRILKDEDKCYLEADFDLRFLKDNKHFIWTSERSGWKEIYLYDLSGKLVKQLTDAKLPVGRILGVDEEKGWVYFTGYENRGLESHAYRVKLDGKKLTRLTKEPGSHSVSLSPGAKYYADSFSSFEKPRRVAIHRADGKMLRIIGKSTITQKLKDLKLIKPEHFTFKSADGKHILDAVLFKPAHFDENEKYPLIMSVYGGPGAKRIANRFNLYSSRDRSQALAQLGFIVLSIDHRGVNRRGKAFQNLMYLNLGQIELEDHVAAAKLVGARPYVDEKRVGIFGHSYGGYLTCMALLKAPEVFHVGISGAPVTAWENYDTIYTERYMRRPQDNPEGYKKGSCLNYAKGLKGHLSLHHGAIDNNVHPGNAIQLAQALLKLNKKFDLMLYPEQRHGISFNRYSEARVEYFVEHLKPDVK